LIPQKMFFLLNTVESEVVGRVFGAEINRVFALDQQTFSGAAFILINVIILAFVMAKLLYNPVKGFLTARTERIQAQLDHAENEKKEASAYKADYEEKRKKIDLEREEIITEARKEGEKLKQSIIDEAKAEADAIRDRALRNVEMEHERVKDEMKQSIIELSSVMAQRFIARTIDQETQEKLFTEVMTELSDADFKAESRVG